MPNDPLRADLGSFLTAHEAELIDFRRDMHAHPELGYHEHRATRRIALRLAAAGLRPMILPKGTGLIADIGDNTGGSPLVALRADLDALPLSDEKQVSYRSTVPNACHACGHDVHTTIVLGAGLFLAQQAAAGRLPGRVRLIFQPAEEVAGGALDVMAAGGPHLRAALRPAPGHREGRGAQRPHHRRLRPHYRPGHRAGRSYRPAPFDC
jgi:metal-dependent amidase/aminoacylase/carboxypeptidase family protein